MAHTVTREVLALDGLHFFPRGTVLSRKWEWRLRGLLRRWLQRGWLRKDDAPVPEEQAGVVTRAEYLARAALVPAEDAPPAPEGDAGAVQVARRDSKGHVMGRADERPGGSPCLHGG